MTPEWGDGHKERRISDHPPHDWHEWRREVDAQFKAVNDRLDEGATEIAENTKLTKQINEKLTPIAEGWEVVQMGLKVLGGVGKVGKFLINYWKPIAAVIVFIKILFLGGWAEAVDGFKKIFNETKP